MNIPFHKPVLPKNIDTILSDSIRNGWLTTGPEVQYFEESLSSYLNAKYVIAVNSCTAALHLSLASKGFKKGDKFAAPTYTFVSTVEVGEYLGMEPVLIDCDNDYNIDLDMLEDRINNDSKIKCILPVHFAGRPVDMDNIFSIANSNGLFVVEDAAHALETKSNVGKVGNTQYATAFSFYANKNITTAGEGGAVSTNDRALARKIRKLSLHGMSKDGWKRFKIGKKWQYDISELGYKNNMTDISAAFGHWQLKHIQEWHDKRSLIVKEYQSNFKHIEGIICPKTCKINEKNAYHLYIIRIIPIKWKINRNKIIQLLNEAGIGTSVHYIPVHMHSYYIKKYGYKISDFPKAKEFSENVISLPLYPLLNNKDINYIIEFVISLWTKYKS